MASDNDGHKYRFGPPAGGWPDFSKRKSKEQPVSYKGIYISGPMRNIPDYNFPAFFAAEDFLAARLPGTIYNPARKDEEAGFNPSTDEPTSEFLQKAFRWDIEAVLKSSLIVLLPGWQKSQGATLELAVARAVGVAVAQLKFEGGKPQELIYVNDASLDVAPVGANA